MNKKPIWTVLTIFGLILAFDGPIMASESPETFTDHFVLVSLIGGIVAVVGVWLHYSITSILKRFERTLEDIDERLRHADHVLTRLQTLHPEGTHVGHGPTHSPHQLKVM
mgnify:CR=1 FL=1